MANFPSESPFYQNPPTPEQLQLFSTKEYESDVQKFISKTTMHVVADLIQEALDILETDGDSIEAERLLREAMNELG